VGGDERRMEIAGNQADQWAGDFTGCKGNRLRLSGRVATIKAIKIPGNQRGRSA
jgi:hypothetical protein